MTRWIVLTVGLDLDDPTDAAAKHEQLVQQQRGNLGRITLE